VEFTDSPTTVTPATPATPATPVTPVTPATPATPARGKGFLPASLPTVCCVVPMISWATVGPSLRSVCIQANNSSSSKGEFQDQASDESIVIKVMPRPFHAVCPAGGHHYAGGWLSTGYLQTHRNYYMYVMLLLIINHPQGRMARGSYGFPKGSLRLAMPNPSTPCRQPPLKRPYAMGRFSGVCPPGG
jgi:hypothetical protein